MVNTRCSASDRMHVPARPAQHVHRGVPDMRRRTRRSASTIGGGTPDMTIGRAAADRAGARPYRATRCENAPKCAAPDRAGARPYLRCGKINCGRESSRKCRLLPLASRPLCRTRSA